MYQILYIGLFDLIKNVLFIDKSVYVYFRTKRELDRQQATFTGPVIDADQMPAYDHCNESQNRILIPQMITNPPPYMSHLNFHSQNSSDEDLPPPYTPDGSDTAHLVSHVQGHCTETPPAYQSIDPMMRTYGRAESIYRFPTGPQQQEHAGLPGDRNIAVEENRNSESVPLSVDDLLSGNNTPNNSIGRYQPPCIMPQPIATIIEPDRVDPVPVMPQTHLGAVGGSDTITQPPLQETAEEKVEFYWKNNKARL
jgi:hypothetical protein